MTSNRTEDELIKLQELMLDYSQFSRTFEKLMEETIYSAMHGSIPTESLLLELARLRVGLKRNTEELTETIDHFVGRVKKQRKAV